MSFTYLEELAQKAATLCKERGWGRDWREGGCYLHLESSEFTEALRGKGDPEKEAADVLFVLASTCAANGIDFIKVLERFEALATGAAVTSERTPSSHAAYLDQPTSVEIPHWVCERHEDCGAEAYCGDPLLGHHPNQSLCGFHRVTTLTWLRGHVAILYCSACKKQHIDEGAFAQKTHKTHRCVDDAAGKGCGSEWETEVPCIGVAGGAARAAKRPQPCLDETKMNGYTDQFPGTDDPTAAP